MNYHKTEHGWTTYVIKGRSEDSWSNHHYTADGLIGERVTEETATHAIVVEIEDGEIISEEVVDISTVLN